ncbi:hypothetical protein BBJ28_00027218, partial [Nothophytophthora sp. Chile5]
AAHPSTLPTWFLDQEAKRGVGAMIVPVDQWHSQLSLWMPLNPVDRCFRLVPSWAHDDDVKRGAGLVGNGDYEWRLQSALVSTGRGYVVVALCKPDTAKLAGGEAADRHTEAAVSRGSSCSSGSWTRTLYEGDAEALRVRLVQACTDVELFSPWEVAFPSCLQLPIDVSEHPSVATEMKRFWKTHKRAVWERSFWAPFASKKDGPNYDMWHDRRCRQRLASKAFERLVLLVHASLGARFFVALDEQPKHEGWWYASAPVDLLLLAQQHGDYVWTYLLTLSAKRFPEVIGAGIRGGHGMGNGVSASMWSDAHNVRHVLDNIKQLKEKQKLP